MDYESMMKYQIISSLLVSWLATVCGATTSTTTESLPKKESEDYQPAIKTYSFPRDCELARRQQILTVDQLLFYCGTSMLEQSNSAQNEINDLSNDGVDGPRLQTDYHDILPVKEWPEFKNWQITTMSSGTGKDPLRNVDWSKFEDLLNGKYQTMKPDIVDVPTPPPHNWHTQWDSTDDTMTKSSFGITGVVIGLGALVVLAVVMSIGIVYCCRSRHNRRLRQHRLFLITARADEDYEQFRHDMETTPPCVGLHVECPPSYEDALHHSATPPQIVIDSHQTQGSMPSPPSYSVVVDDVESFTHTDLTEAGVAPTASTLSSDLERILSVEETIPHLLSSSSQLVLLNDDSKDTQ